MSKRYEHLHYCEYRDTETGLVASNYVEVMNEQDQKIKDLETKLAEKDELLEDYRQFAIKLKEELGNVDCEYKTQIFTLKRTLIDECKEHRDFCRIADKKVKGLEQQLKEERKNVCDFLRQALDIREHHPIVSIKLVSQEWFFHNLLDQIERGGNNGNQ